MRSAGLPDGPSPAARGGKGGYAGARPPSNADALSGGDARLDDVLDAVETPASCSVDVARARGLALDARGCDGRRARGACGPSWRRARARCGPWRRGARRLQLRELLLGRRAGAERSTIGGGRRRPVAGLERGADVGQRGALGERRALLGVRAGGTDVRRGGVTRLVAGRCACDERWTSTGLGRRARGRAARDRRAYERPAFGRPSSWRWSCGRRSGGGLVVVRPCGSYPLP